MDKLFGGFVLFLFGLAAVGYLIMGIIWVIANFWWVIVPSLLLVGWLVVRSRHPAVKASRQIKLAAKRGDDARADIKAATASAKADMDRIARNWPNS
jgi:hypothetical protein